MGVQSFIVIIGCFLETCLNQDVSYGEVIIHYAVLIFDGLGVYKLISYEIQGYSGH